MTEKKRLEATVHGRVQGVGFRWFVRSNAARLKLVGWVSNDPSGSVVVVAEGDDDAIDEMATELRKGPPGAVVDGVDTAFPPPTGEFGSFAIRPGGHSGD